MDTVSPNPNAIITEYEAAYNWILSLIRGDAKVVRKLAPESKLARYQARMDNLAAFAEFIGNPQNKFKSVHIAGTSGKGSVTVLIAALLTACGFKTGDHVSPYLQLCIEKLRINDEMIKPSAFVELVDSFRQEHDRWLAQGGKLRYGQAWVALTFWWLAREQVDWGVVETGMGGRFNGTNLLPSELAVITNVDYDHVKSIGPTLEQIAWHKSGIIKPHHEIVVTAEKKANVLEVFQEEAQKNDARLYQIQYVINDDGTFLVTTPHSVFSNVPLALQGGFQYENAALAVTAVDILAHRHGFELSDKIVQETLNSVVFPGRVETVQTNPTIILDGAHNPHKMEALANTLRSAYPDKKLTLIVGMISTKNVTDGIEKLGSLAERIIVTEPNVYQKPAHPAGQIVHLIQQQFPNLPITALPKVQDAIDLAISTANDDTLIVVTGSIYLIGEARERWYPKNDILMRLEFGDSE